MKRFIVALFTFLCLFSNAIALTYDDIQKGMSYQEVLAALKEFEVEEKEFETSKSIIVKNKDYDIGIGFKKEVNKASAIYFTKYGKKTSSIDLFVPDWSLEMDDVMDVLEAENAEYKFHPSETRFAIRNGERVKLEQPETIYTVRCYGYMDYIPVEYYLTFDSSGKLAKVDIGPTGIKEENKESNYLILLTYLGELLGAPAEAKTDDYTSFSSEDGGAILDDVCYWEYKGSQYKITIETLVEQDSNDDDLFKADFYKTVSLIVTEIE